MRRDVELCIVSKKAGRRQRGAHITASPSASRAGLALGRGSAPSDTGSRRSVKYVQAQLPSNQGRLAKMEASVEAAQAELQKALQELERTREGERRARDEAAEVRGHLAFSGAPWYGCVHVRYT